MKRISGISTALLILTANLFFGSSAYAHDEAVSVLPESGSSVEAGIVDLNITFNEDVMETTDGSGFEVLVANQAGDSQVVGCVSPMGNTLSARTALAKAGDYTVSWRSVSNDGHPTEGSYTFTVANSAEVDADLINNCPRLLIAPGPSIEDPEAIAYSSAGEAIANDNTALELGALVLVLLVVLALAIWVTRKAKRSKN